jgi:hypothetical protein
MGTIVYGFFLLFENGQLGTNQYGADPTAMNNSFSNHNNQRDANSNVPFESIIPEKCPVCKNPNTQKEKICEWCGNFIY